MARGTLTSALHKLIRAFTPRRAVIAAGLLDVFLRRRGQARRNRAGLCINGQGQPIPWLTYPAIDFFESLDLRQARVFEFGMGSSTAYWARRGCIISGVEMDSAWHARIEALALPNVTAAWCANHHHYPHAIDGTSGTFEIILVDGAERFRSAQQAIPRLSTGGILVLDNSEWYPSTAGMLRDAGLTQIDLCGFPPLNAFESVTSLFFRERIALPRVARAADWHPIGGRSIPGGAIDDKPE